MALFTLEDSFIASVCFGMDDASAHEFWLTAVDAGRDVIETAVATAVNKSTAFKGKGDQIEVWYDTPNDEAMYVVTAGDLDAAMLESEYGAGGGSPTPLLRTAVLQSAQSAAKAISAALEMT